MQPRLQIQQLKLQYKHKKNAHIQQISLNIDVFTLADREGFEPSIRY